MVTPIRRWMGAWSRMREQRSYLGQRWVEPSNAVTRAVLGDKRPPALPHGPLFAPRYRPELRRRALLRSFEAELTASLVPPARRSKRATTPGSQRRGKRRPGWAA